ncbi:hypothetical protein [Streptomyces litchfieldiae]|uniref:Uncharacterized protein n=1 Tax=Streptomyces litchfieldiae TaxID=3075543 RepID=A0ABU2MZ06_9ACTN|nr:hypothetical protein [Streptomyces sp. DSM 44938]MDT0346043.1 hypothetical protein [Streptomyces sp. DSM 44938]
MERVVGYLFAGAAHGDAERRAGPEPGLPRELDRLPELDRLCELVRERLGQDPALRRAREEAAAGRAEPTERTRRRLADALEDAAERDPAFADALRRAVAVLGGDVSLTADHGSVAALSMRDVTVHRPRQPGPERG